MAQETDPCEAIGKLQLLTHALLDDIGIFDALELIYSEFASLIPFQRIGCAEVDTELDHHCYWPCSTKIVRCNRFAEKNLGTRVIYYAIKPTKLPATANASSYVVPRRSDLVDGECFDPDSRPSP